MDLLQKRLLSMHFLSNRRSRDPEGDSHGCAHAQPEVAQYHP